MGQAARDDAELYRLTGDERYARRFALILRAFADVMPGWVPWFSRRDEARPANRPLHLRSYFPPTAESEVFVGETPSVRPANRDDAEVRKHWRPSLLLRRPVPADGRANEFVAIHEAFRDQPSIHSIEMLQAPARDRAPVLRIAHAEGTDLVISSPKALATSVAGVSTRGRLGILRQKPDGSGDVFLYDTPSLAFQDREFTAPPSATVAVQAISRDGSALVVSAPPADSKALLRPGAPLRVGLGDGTLHAYSLEEVKTNDDGTLSLLTRPHPGFRIEADGSARETHFPRRSLPGPVRLHIDSIFEEAF